ncbi:GNAT family N-acetyltransferase [Rhizobium sp. SSA_523]|uniref:GNAT family N-acetyltransferase n=1 Tax=Rhizobium sp. SSA_523 TaxID=2952477 RepID=UPI00208FFDB3|nr:GNAT family N-acetyltransferase [Rhizobium sp. SSA_523]MCO5732863.1 GNAT family N-acetyltransferase [Rhizobium sp. SSA_523]WKC23520.1 GNAT family N-acetyltransferase [Rhizobium sp. SSA_523]
MVTIAPVSDQFDRFEDLLALILSAFAFMDDRIDPPSSAHRLTPMLLKDKAGAEIGFLAEENGTLLGCIFCKPETGSLYIGKLAVLPGAQGRGLGLRLLAAAEAEARRLGLSRLRLETRIELIENHERFARWGFSRTAERSHAGYDRITYIEMTKQLEA